MSKKSNPKRRRKPAGRESNEKQTAAAKAKRGDVKSSHSESADSKSTDSGASMGNWAVPLVVIVVVGIVAYFWLKPLTTSELIEQVRSDYQAGEHGLVIGGVEQLLQRDSATPELLMIGADSAKAYRHYDRALQFMNAVDDTHDGLSVEARVSSGEILYDLGKAGESETQFRRALSLDPDHLRANHRLSILLNVLGKRWESSAYAFKALKENRLDLQQLVLFSNRNPSAKVGPAIDFFIEQGAGDPRAKLTSARELVNSEKAASAISDLKEILEADPDNVEAYAFLGRAIWQLGEDAEFANWYQNAPFKAKRHPDFWLIVGYWARDHGQHAAAAKAYWQALLRDPDIRDANFQLSRLISSGKVSVAKEFGEQLRLRSEDVRELNLSIADIMTNRDQLSLEENGEDLKQIVDLMSKLGRKWESYAWARQTTTIPGEAEWAIERRDQLKSELHTALPRFTVIPAKSIDLSDLPEPSFDSESTNPNQSVTGGNIQFANATKATGIDFVFYNARTDDHRVLYMYELMGASVCVVDFNVDGWPDVYFPQGTAWPIDEEQTEFYDKLFLNRGDGSFDEVSAQADLSQNGFGQNASVGDFDADGFPDLFISNINGNRLLRNNGDGTYSDVTDTAGIKSEGWTVAGVMVDLNGDTLPDIYEVNYLAGDNVFTKTCRSGEKPISCPPRDFEKAQDYLWINNGDGTFENATNVAKIPAGKGLGIVAADINGDQLVDLFVGNDGEENHLLVNESKDGVIAMRESGAGLGVDVDGAGATQACMGIAVLDVNRDQKLDFFVTNFAREYNTLYQSEAFGFSDATRRANLSSPGYGFVGFGTQALDAELDGDDDLLITNGHVQDYFDPDRPYEMPSIVLENVGAGKFKERDSEAVGKYFGLPQVGRGMARLDWNRDGLQEVIIGNLDRPAVVLRNESERAGQFISLKLIGVDSSRDAVGTAVTVSDNECVTYRQLTAGDGYGSGNQREMNFAVKGDQVDSIEIVWPSGKASTFENVAAGKFYTAIENASELIPRVESEGPKRIAVNH